MWNAMPMSDAEKTFDAIAEKTGCARAPDVVACFEGKGTDELRAAAHFDNQGIRNYPCVGANYWGPVIDGIDVIGHVR